MNMYGGTVIPLVLTADHTGFTMGRIYTDFFVFFSRLMTQDS